MGHGWLSVICILQLVICLSQAQILPIRSFVFANESKTLVLNGAEWGLTFVNRTVGNLITMNGTIDRSTRAVLALVIVDGRIWQQNSNLDWWSKRVPADAWAPGPGTPIPPFPDYCVNYTGPASGKPSNTCNGYGTCTFYGLCNCTSRSAGFGGPLCRTCSNGFTFPNCDVTCGNGVCESGKENCLTCPQDCPSPCGMCGDGVCSAGETCSRCPLDCAHTCPIKCQGSPECNGQGKCLTSGVCDCNTGFSGPACADKTVPIALGITNTTSGRSTQGVRVSADNSSPAAQSVNFYIGITQADEITPSGSVVQSYPLPNITQAFALQNQTSYANIYVAKQIIRSGSNAITFTLTLYMFSASHAITFANQTTTYASGSLKLTVEISHWPFLAISNSLMLKLLSSTDLAKDDVCDTYSGFQQQDELKWVQINNGGNALYVQFQSTALIDSFPKPLSFKWLDNGVTGVTIPYFWTNAVLDPSYQMLIDSEKPKSNIELAGCAKRGGVAGWKIGVAVAVVAVVVIVGVLLFIFRERAIKLTRQRLMK